MESKLIKERVGFMRSAYYPKKEIEHLLAALMPQNRLACEISLQTGLRINDVLSLRTAAVMQGEKFSIKEQKTGKVKRVRLSKDLLERCRNMSGNFYVFEHRLNSRKHRTRQAVYKDLKRIASIFRIKENVVPHSLRKVYAVEQYNKSGGNIEKVRKLLNHSDEAVTIIYAMADVLNKRKKGKW